MDEAAQRGKHLDTDLAHPYHLRMITRSPWFGPKKYLGWGWTPLTWHGWIVTFLAIAAIGAAADYFGPTVVGYSVMALIVAALVSVAILTGTKPGGPGSGLPE